MLVSSSLRMLIPTDICRCRSCFDTYEGRAIQIKATKHEHAHTRSRKKKRHRGAVEQEADQKKCHRDGSGQPTRRATPRSPHPAEKREMNKHGAGERAIHHPAVVSPPHQHPKEQRQHNKKQQNLTCCWRSGSDAAAPDGILEASIAVEARVGGGRTAPHERRSPRSCM